MRAVAIFAVLVAVLLGGCNNAPPLSPSPPAPKQSVLAERVGENCTVQFRRGDGLGAGGDSPVSPNTGSINGTEVSVSGQLRAVSAGWIAVESGNTEYCIPRESILLVQFNK
jgi:hypothetical protein